MKVFVLRKNQTINIHYNAILLSGGLKINAYLIWQAFFLAIFRGKGYNVERDIVSSLLLCGGSDDKLIVEEWIWILFM